MNARDFTFEPSAKIVGRMQTLAGIGAATLVAGLFLAPHRIWLNLLLVSYYLLGLALAGMAWIAIQYVSGAHWSTALRRVPEAMSGVLPLGALGIICILILHPSLYPWTGGLHVQGDVVKLALFPHSCRGLSVGLARVRLGHVKDLPSAGFGR
jgi:hypothetical protein